MLGHKTGAIQALEDRQMSDDELVVLCRDIIKTHIGRTQMDYYVSVNKFNVLYEGATSTFQRECIRTAHNRLWRPQELTLICLFDDLG